MKDIRFALHALLTATDGGFTRIYPVVLPQGVTNPSIIYNFISESSDYHMLGSSGLSQARFQIDCWSLTPDQSVLLANQVYDILSGFRGTVPYGTNSPQDSIVIQAVFHDQGSETYDAIAKLYTRRRDYLFWYTDR